MNEHQQYKPVFLRRFEMDTFVKEVRSGSAVAHIMKNDEPANKENPYWWKLVSGEDVQSESMCWFVEPEHAEEHFAHQAS